MVELLPFVPVTAIIGADESLRNRSNSVINLLENSIICSGLNPGDK